MSTLQSRRGTTSGRDGINVPSSLLSDQENKEVYNLIGSRCTVSQRHSLLMLLSRLGGGTEANPDLSNFSVKNLQQMFQAWRGKFFGRNFENYVSKIG